MTNTKPQVGDIHQFDFQSDVFRGQYRLIEDLGRGSFLCEYLEPSDELIEEATRYYLEAEHPYLGYVDPFGPGRRRATRQESLDEEILNRIDRAGQTLTIQFVSREQWASYF